MTYRDEGGKNERSDSDESFGPKYFVKFKYDPETAFKGELSLRSLSSH